MEPFPSTTRIYSLVRQEEKQQKIHSSLSPTPHAATFVTKPTNRGGQLNRKPRYHYDHCGLDGHTKDHCFKLVGYPQRRLMLLLRQIKLKTVPWCHHHPSLNFCVCLAVIVGIGVQNSNWLDDAFI